jgi:exopolyphosphatase / guanosine-5'-triphosphate,3'-diphosphate pyrophosphatase
MVKKLTRTAQLEAARAFAAAHDPDPDHAEHVRGNSLILFDAFQELHGLGARERFLLEAAAILHDIGYATRPEQHQKGSRDLILASELESFTPKELAVIACIARYHGKNLPKTSHKVYKDLRKSEQEVVRKLAAIIRIADGLDRSHSGTATPGAITRTEDAVTLCVPQGASDYDIDAAARKADLFGNVFGMQFRIIVARGS